MNDREFLERTATMDDVPMCGNGSSEHREVCGFCYHNFLWAEVAREMLAANDVENGVHRWAEETQVRWRNGKFFKFYQEEQAAGRNPTTSFEEKGWGQLN